MDKFVLYKNKASKRQSSGYTSVNLYPEAFELLKDLRNETGRGIGAILNEMITFCADRLEVRDYGKTDENQKTFKVKKVGGYRSADSLYGLCGRNDVPSARSRERDGQELPDGFFNRLGRLMWEYGIR